MGVLCTAFTTQSCGFWFYIDTMVTRILFYLLPIVFGSFFSNNNYCIYGFSTFSRIPYKPKGCTILWSRAYIPHFFHQLVFRGSRVRLWHGGLAGQHTQLLLLCCLVEKWRQNYFMSNIGQDFFTNLVRRKCGPVVGALDLRSGDPGFKTCSGHWLHLFSAALVNNQIACLQPVGILNSCC